MCRCPPRHATPRRLRPMLPASAGLDIAPLGYPGVLGGIRQAPCRTQGPPYWPSCIVRRCDRVRFSGTAGCCATCCAGGTGCGPSSTRSCSSCGRHAADTAAEARACALARAITRTRMRVRARMRMHARTRTERACSVECCTPRAGAVRAHVGQFCGLSNGDRTIPSAARSAARLEISARARARARPRSKYRAGADDRSAWDGMLWGCLHGLMRRARGPSCCFQSLQAA
jgi:hypothetical protein